MRIVLLGSGNVATHLGKALKLSGHKFIQVWSRNHLHAQELAEQLEAEAISSSISALQPADLYLIAVKDDAIAETAEMIPLKSALLVHTAGSVDLNIFSNKFENTGVMYPVQTFSKTKEVDFKTIPIAVEASNQMAIQAITELAKGISDRVFDLNSNGRLALHIAAVLACNFTNHLYALAENLLNQQSLEFSLIHPLIAETAAKAQTISPLKAQTGPAIRNDELTLQKHLQFLKPNPTVSEIYSLLSQSILTLDKTPGN